MIIIFIIILLICFLLSLKLKISLYVKFDNFDVLVKTKILFKTIERKGALVNRKRKHQIRYNPQRKNKQKFNFKNINKIVKHMEIDKLNINSIVGTQIMFFTVFSVPVLSTILEMVKGVPFKKLENYSYVIMPNYNEFKLFVELNAVLKVRVFDLILIRLKSNMA